MHNREETKSNPTAKPTHGGSPTMTRTGRNPNPSPPANQHTTLPRPYEDPRALTTNRHERGGTQVQARRSTNTQAPALRGPAGATHRNGHKLAPALEGPASMAKPKDGPNGRTMFNPTAHTTSPGFMETRRRDTKRRPARKDHVQPAGPCNLFHPKTHSYTRSAQANRRFGFHSLTKDRGTPNIRVKTFLAQSGIGAAHLLVPKLL
ncbi:hypothetical protein KP509_19G079500 [Ceratopteris richardii]|uniref:Uncharacterized protein n=1 Tax=Ceratopteris richardii TaxID=49495 RepID=A0A8T2SMP9_CERRI|nr:hypothetical protein KP509_19G079500 [Ceratopteris richardii]